ncbi:hypothetical protein VAA049_3457 [Vibrio cholerae]|nr:hypothetical protein VAA049_3457 [Vibrio cholerae]EGR2418601.1 hypothetical protein [Vibrio cholerae]BCN17539.1 hypothetical protein [Vibrio cholerae]BCN20664.1 hypothetical protein [Vibrio cholerae]GIA30822.1 hypothetical protein VCSRO130_2404 [Vibrio cholerae]
MIKRFIRFLLAVLERNLSVKSCIISTVKSNPVLENFARKILVVIMSNEGHKKDYLTKRGERILCHLQKISLEDNK